MRIALIADVHSNLAALRAVLDHAEAQRPVDALWVLGDTVGYCSQPNECIELLRRYPQVAVAGNHDLAALEQLDTSSFNPWAAAAAAWTAGVLNADARAYLTAQPKMVRQDSWTLVHGTLRDPLIEYLFSSESAAAHLQLQATPFGAVGHTHVPAVAEMDGDSRLAALRQLSDGDAVELEKARRIVVNPGGVGQPRDGDPRAAYALYDDETGVVSFHRVPYDVAATQAAMATAGLPRPLIDRLSFGR